MAFNKKFPMTITKLVWFIDSRVNYKKTSFNKVAYLATLYGSEIHVLIDKRVKAFERWYWPQLDPDNTLMNDSEAKFNQLKETLTKNFSQRGIQTTISGVEKTDHLTSLNQVLDDDNSLVMIEHQNDDKKHAIFQSLHLINASTLVLTDKPWSTPLNMIAAVDPLHENARPENIDEHIAELLKEIATQSKARWTVIHSCFIASVLYEYEKRILEMHKDEFNDFAKRMKIDKSHICLIEGQPEEALETYIKKNKVDIMIIGLVARNFIEQMWVGSTTTALLDDVPCDMLLVRR